MKPRLLLLALLAIPRVASATPDDDRALATELFAKGVKKMDAGKCDQPKITDPAICEEAREHFTRAYEIYPAGLGALRNLAYVERGLGHYASAARRFRDLQQRAPQDPNPKRHIWAEYATKELEAIGPLIPHVTIHVPPEATSVTIDGKPLPAGAWGTAVEIDPGSHKVHVEGKGVDPFDHEVTLVEKENKTVTVTFVEKKVDAPPPPPPPVVVDKPSRVAPLVVAGVGGATVIVGLVFGYMAITGKKDACGDTKLCEPAALEDARSNARTSNIVTGVGAAVLVGGLTWYFLAPSSSSASETKSARVAPVFGPGFAGAALTGVFQ
jgi:hypothetical protein